MPTYAHTVIAGATGTLEHPIGFTYSRAADVEVYVDNVLIAQGSGATQYIFSSSGTKITFTSPNEPLTGETLEIRRVTDISSAVVSYASGGGATKSDLNAAVKQLLDSIDELQFPAFEKTYTLTEIEAGISVAHNLGAIPTRVDIMWECTTNDFFWTAGDFVPNDSFDVGLQVYFTTTLLQVDASVTNTIRLHDKVSNLPAAIASAKWSVRIKAWR